MDKGIGSRLRDARQERGLDLDEVHERTKIRRSYLQALEEERWDQLPAPAYTRGFLRTYARMLGLDAERLVADYRDAEPEPEPEVVPQLSDEHLEMGVGSRILAALDSLRPAGRRTPVSGGGQGPGRGPSLAVILAVALVALLVVGLVVSDDDDPAPVPGMERERPGDEGEAAEAPEGETAEAEAPEEEADARPARIALELTAVGDVWVCLVDRRGNVLVDGEILTPGEERGPFRGRSFDAGLGNGQIEITADGEEIPIAESSDPVGYRITPDRARELDEGARPTCA
jgi:transcriptional regulator with XRE-family HTH domain